MADFKTHMYVASPLSGLAAGCLLVTDQIHPEEVILYFALGCIGTMLPDIDADNSVPLRLLFNVMVPLVLLLFIFSKGFCWSLIELFITWLTGFLFIKYVVFPFFTHLTVHRGVLHSIPAAFLFWFATTVFLDRAFDFSSFRAWLAGFFVFAGFIVHLVLDEIYSLNIFGGQIKKSFGTAFTLIKLNDLKTTFLLYMLVITLFTFTPDPKPFFTRIMSRDFYRRIHLFPQDDWFQNGWILTNPRQRVNGPR
jgi:hypothetical protein